MEAAITFMVVITPLCNSPSGMYILVEFSVKTSAGRQIFHQVPFSVRSLFCVFQTYTNDICWVCKCHTGGAANWPGKMENLTRFCLGRVIFHWMKEKNLLGLLQRGALFHTRCAISYFT